MIGILIWLPARQHHHCLQRSWHHSCHPVWASRSRCEERPRKYLLWFWRWLGHCLWFVWNICIGLAFSSCFIYLFILFCYVLPPTLACSYSLVSKMPENYSGSTLSWSAKNADNLAVLHAIVTGLALIGRAWKCACYMYTSKFEVMDALESS